MCDGIYGTVVLATVVLCQCERMRITSMNRIYTSYAFAFVFGEYLAPSWDQVRFFFISFSCLLLTFWTTALIDFLSFVSAKLQYKLLFLCCFPPILVPPFLSLLSPSPPPTSLYSFFLSFHWFCFIQSFIRSIVRNTSISIHQIRLVVHSFVCFAPNFALHFDVIHNDLCVCVCGLWTESPNEVNAINAFHHYFRTSVFNLGAYYVCVCALRSVQPGSKTKRTHWAYTISN